jgi:two-component SAPR family response regulator
MSQSQAAMHQNEANPASLYLPLLTNPQPDVRRQACAILLGTYGEHALTYMRRLLDDPDPQLRDQARMALQAVSEITGITTKTEPFAGIYIECLGRLRVYVDNREVHAEEWKQHEDKHAGWQRVQACFAYLVHCGRRGTTRAALSKAVWDAPASSAGFSRMLSALQRALAGIIGPEFVECALVIGHDHYALAPETYHTDVQLFESTFDLACHVEETHDLEAAEPLYTQALQIYGGPYMADITRSAHWSQVERDRLLNSFVIAAERVTEYSYTRQDYQHCITICSQALNVEENADDLVVWLLRAYGALGMLGELEHAYQHYLRAAVDPCSPEDQEDVVVQTYKELIRMRPFDE